jgi:outer membrane lipoprotein-sorting protein
MKESFLTISKRLALVICVASALASCAAKNSMNALTVQDLINDVEKKAYLIKQFRADFVRTRLTSVFSRDVTVKGKLVFQKPNRFSLTMTGDANVEIVSDGSTISLVHDRIDREVYHVQGERDLSKFADPLMLLINSIGSGGLREFSEIRKVEGSDGFVMEIQPGNNNHFERIRSVILSLEPTGEIKKVNIYFKDGERDEVVFESWALLAQDDPEVLQLETRLRALSRFQPEEVGGSAPRPLSMVSQRNQQISDGKSLP